MGVTRATPPITTAKADLLLKELLERVKKVNSNTDLGYKVENVKVFGSYLANKEILSDIDVAIKLEKKVAGDEFISKSEERIKYALKNGKTFCAPLMISCNFLLVSLLYMFLIKIIP